MPRLTAGNTRLRLRTAFIVWGLLAIAGWCLVLLPAYVVVDQGPAVVQALFGTDEATPHNLANPDDPASLGRIAPASGGSGN